jgi:hypothetical protein
VNTECWCGHLREGLFGRTNRRWDDNIEIDLQEMKWSRYIAGLFWWRIDKLRAIVSMLMNIWVSK